MSRELVYTFHADSGRAVSLRAFLKQHRYPKSALKRLVYGPDQVFLDGEAAKLTTILKDGQTILVRVAEEEGSDVVCPVEVPLKILYEDEDILVIDKPPFLPIHSSPKHYDQTLANAVAWHDRQNGREKTMFHCLNRLDRDTSGVTLVARNSLSAAILGEAVKKREVKREYLAIVEGITEERGVITAPIGRTEGSVITRQVDFEKGESAETFYERLEVRRAASNSFYSLLRIRLGTGRTHQIRVHMKYIGHPLPGDYLYHPVYDRIDRQPLHSASLQFYHPITQELMLWQAPMPEDMRRMWEGLEPGEM